MNRYSIDVSANSLKVYSASLGKLDKTAKPLHPLYMPCNLRFWGSGPTTINHIAWSLSYVPNLVATASFFFDSSCRGHVWRKKDDWVKKCSTLEVEGIRQRKTWKDVVDDDMNDWHLELSDDVDCSIPVNEGKWSYSNSDSDACELNTNWRAPWKNRIYWYISFSAHHSIVFCFRCSVYWWKGSVRF